MGFPALVREPKPETHPTLAEKGGDRAPDVPVSGRRLLRNHSPLTKWLEWLATIAAVLVGFELAADELAGLSGLRLRVSAVLCLLCMLLIYPSVGVFGRFRGPMRGLLRLTFAWGLAVCGALALSWFVDPLALSNARPLARGAAYGWIGQVSVFVAFWSGMHVWHRFVRADLPSIVVGTGWMARQLVRDLNRNAFLADRVVGVVGDGDAGDVGAPILGGLDQIEDVIDRCCVDRVYIALPMTQMEEIARLQRTLLSRNLDVIWVPDIFSMHLLNPSVRELGGLPC